MVISTLGVIPFYLFGVTLHGRRAGLFAALLWAVAPFGAMYYNITPRGAYPETICGGALLLWYATERWKGFVFRPGVGFAMGLMAGIILWSRMLIAPAVATVAIAELWRWRLAAFNRLNVAFAVGTLIGAAPIFFNLDAILHNPAVGKMDPMGALGRIEDYWVTLRWAFLPDDPAWLLWLGHGAWLVVASSSAVMFLGALTSLVAGRFAPSSTTLGPLALFTLLFSFIYLSNTASASDQIRYAIPLFSALFPAAGMAFAILYRWKKTVGAGALTLVLGVNLAVNGVLFADLNDERIALDKEIGQTVDTIASLGVTGVVHEDYNREMRIRYDALVKGVPLDIMRNVGSLKYDWTSSVERNPNAGFLVPPHEVADYSRWLRACCGDFKTAPVEGYTLFYDMAPPTPTPVVSIPTNRWRIEEATGLADRNHAATWWGEGTKVAVVELAETVTLAKVRLILGGRWPASIKIETSLDGGAWTSVADAPPSFVYPVGPRPYLRLSWDLDRDYEEWNFAPTPTRFVRLTMVATGTWDAHDLFLYATEEAAPIRPDWRMAPDELMATVKEAGGAYLAVNRWWRARLAGIAEREGIALAGPSFIEATTEDTSRIRLKPGVGGLVDPADADELTARLRERGVPHRRLDTRAGSLFVFDGDGGEVWWTGFTFIDEGGR